MPSSRFGRVINRLADSTQIFTCRKQFQTNYSTCFGSKRSKFQISRANFALRMSTRAAAPPDRAREDLRGIFNAGVKAVLPGALIESKLRVEGNKLFVGNESFFLRQRVYLVGFGKAVMGMATVIERMLGDRLVRGIVSVPRGSNESIWDTVDFPNFPRLSGPIEYREGSTDNQPDADALATSDDIIDMVEPLTDQDTLIVLISGGGSALFCMPRPLLDLKEKQEFCKKLQDAGADITELNTVRKKLSMVKGGRLARMAHPAKIISLILSDIVGDPIDLIASGPTAYGARTPEEVASILKKYNLYDSMDGDLRTIVTSKEVADDKTLLDENKRFKHVSNVIVGNNLVAMEAAKREALRKGLAAVLLRNDVQGDVHAVSLAYAKLTSFVCLALEKHLVREKFFEEMWKDPVLSLSGDKVDEIYDMVEDASEQGIILIGGGEPTVVVKGKGKGGRNQELALHFSLDWFTKVKQDPRLAEYEVVMLSGGTDGRDGPTDVAGAFGYPAIGPIIFDLRKKLRVIERKQMLEEMNKKMAGQPLVEEEAPDLCKFQETEATAVKKNVGDETKPESIPDREEKKELQNENEKKEQEDENVEKEQQDEREKREQKKQQEEKEKKNAENLADLGELLRMRKTLKAIKEKEMMEEIKRLEALKLGGQNPCENKEIKDTAEGKNKAEATKAVIASTPGQNEEKGQKDIEKQKEKERQKQKEIEREKERQKEKELREEERQKIRDRRKKNEKEQEKEKEEDSGTLDPGELLELSPLQLKLLQLERLVPQNTLKNNDTYNFYSRFKRGQDFLRTGITGTNVMDLHIIRITKRQCGCRVAFTKGTICPDPFDEHDLDTDLTNVKKLVDIPKEDKEPEYLNLKILDSNLADPCCNKKRKH